jgi:hypothetical protein
VCDDGEPDVAESGPRELKARDLAGLQIAADFHQHAALAKIQDAADAQPAPAGP